MEKNFHQVKNVTIWILLTPTGTTDQCNSMATFFVYNFLKEYLSVSDEYSILNY